MPRASKRPHPHMMRVCHSRLAGSPHSEAVLGALFGIMCMNSSVVWPRVSSEVAPKMAGTFWARSRTRAAVLLACVEGPVAIALWIRGGLCAMVGSLLESARNIDITMLNSKAQLEYNKRVWPALSSDPSERWPALG